MYMQINQTEFIFSMKTISPQCQYGDDPYLDSTGATQHLTPTYKFQDIEQINWIKDNNIEYTVEITSDNGKRIIKFANIEDAMAFKLRWM